MENFNTLIQNKKYIYNNLKWIYHVKSNEHDSNQYLNQQQDELT